MPLQIEFLKNFSVMENTHTGREHICYLAQHFVHSEFSTSGFFRCMCGSQNAFMHSASSLKMPFLINKMLLFALGSCKVYIYIKLTLRMHTRRWRLCRVTGGGFAMPAADKTNLTIPRVRPHTQLELWHAAIHRTAANRVHCQPCAQIAHLTAPLLEL